MKNYCVGFIFNHDLTKVLLLERNKAPYLGLLNGVGGKIEEGETPTSAMVRELYEETGLSGVTCIPLTTEIFPNGVTLHVFTGRLPAPATVEQWEGEEGILEFTDVFNADLYDVSNHFLAGDGNVPYFIYSGRLLLRGAA